MAGSQPDDWVLPAREELPDAYGPRALRTLPAAGYAYEHNHELAAGGEQA